MPDYQQGVKGVLGNSYRNFPDVVMVAANLEDDSNSQRNPSAGGTSASSPLWAGFMALVNEQNGRHGLGPIGFANPVLYAIAKTMDSGTTDVYKTSFHDIGAGPDLSLIHI